MNTIEQSSPSMFAQMVDRLRHKSEEELKMLYLKFFASDLNNEWKEITSETDFANVSDEEIIRVIKTNRYNN